MSERLVKSAGLIGLATLGSRLLGLVRDGAQAYFFATSDKADAFTVATRIPNLLRDLFAEGAMSAAFVPTLTRAIARGGKEAAWRLGSQVINGLMVVTSLFVVLGILFAGPLTAAYAEKFALIPGKTELTVELTRINMPFLLLVAIAAAYMGMLNALRKFLIPATAPTMFNVVSILSTVIFVPVFMRVGIEPVMALSIGLLGGGLAQIAIQWMAIRREGFRHEWRLDLNDPDLREMLMLMGPATLGLAAAQINSYINTSLATGESGAPTALGYAFRLMYMPIGILGVSVATAAIPEVARHATEKKLESMRSTVSWGVRMMLMMCVPATIGLMVLATPIVELLFERGTFTAAKDTPMVAGALLFYAPGIIGYSVVKIASPAFYSLKESRTPVLVSLGTIATNLALNLSLNSIMGFRGLALGTALTANINAGLLVWLLSRRLGGGDATRIGVAFAKILIASLLMGAASYFTEAWLHDSVPGESWAPRLVRVLAAIGVGIAALAASAHLLRIDEFRAALGRVLTRIKG